MYDNYGKYSRTVREELEEIRFKEKEKENIKVIINSENLWVKLRCKLTNKRNKASK